jgi:hypothetical protein
MTTKINGYDLKQYVADLKRWKNQFEKRIVWIDSELKAIDGLEK